MAGAVAIVAGLTRPSGCLLAARRRREAVVPPAPGLFMRRHSGRDARELRRQNPRHQVGVDPVVKVR